MDMDTESLMGFRFQPTNEEVITLLKMKRLDSGFSVHTIKEIDIYSFDPWELPRYSEIQSKEPVWYFFCEPYYKYAKSKRAHRRTKTGYWKVTGKGSNLKCRNGTEVIGTKRILSFYLLGTASKAAKTEWVMHETAIDDDPLYMKDFVVCRLERKRDSTLTVSTCDEDQSSQELTFCSRIDAAEDNFQESVQSLDQQLASNGDHVTEDNSLDSEVPATAQLISFGNHVAERASLDPMLPPNKEPYPRNHVAENTSPESHLAPTGNLESLIIPNQCCASFSSTTVENMFEAETPHGGNKGLNNPSFTPLQSPIYLEQESLSSNSCAGGLLNSQFESEQSDDLSNTLRAFRKGNSREETGQSFSPDFTSSKSDGGAHLADSARTLKPSMHG